VTVFQENLFGAQFGKLENVYKITQEFIFSESYIHEALALTAKRLFN